MNSGYKKLDHAGYNAANSMMILVNNFRFVDLESLENCYF